MARFSANEADNYGGQGGGGFFSISKNMETKRVRFMYNTIDDIEGMSVHKITVKGKNGKDKYRYVNCLREYNQPIDDCPFCKAKMTPQARLFIPVYNIDEDAVQTWDRGKTMFQQLIGFCKRYSNDRDIVNNVVDIERHGESGDQGTTYQFYYVDNDDTPMEDLPELPKILGGVVMDKTAEEMEYYLDNGEFESNESEQEEEPVRRRESRTPASSRDTGRRTPASNNRSRRNEDTF